MLLVVIQGTGALADDDPAAGLCDGYLGVSDSDRTDRIIGFSSACMAETNRLSDSGHSCVSLRMTDVDPQVQAYCAARSRVAHDLPLEELSDLKNALYHLPIDCFLEESERRSERLKETLPRECGEMASAFARWLDLVQESADSNPAYVECARSRLEQIAAPLQSVCTEGVISLQAAYVELGSRIRAECPVDSD